MAILAGMKASAVDLTLPAIAQGYGNGTNTITATTWTDLPTTACTCSITNPHPTADLLCQVTFSAWMSASASAVRMCPRVSGSVTVAAGPGGIALGWGAIPRGLVEYVSYSAVGYVTLPVSATAATFTMQAYREAASGTQNVNYPVIEVVPLRYVF